MTKVMNAGAGGALLTNDGRIAREVARRQPQPPGFAASARDFINALAWWSATRPGCYGALRTLRGLFRRDSIYSVVAPNPCLRQGGSQPCSSYVARLVGRQLQSLEANVAARQAVARVYAEELADVACVTFAPVVDGAEPAWIQFPIFVEDKEACYRYLLSRGVDLNWTFRYSCGVSYGVHHAPNSERAARTVLGLPTFPGLPFIEARRICQLLRDFARN
jgi:dTDP-4-amino-4,6-dideoxygalactose transaminase